MYLSIRKLSVIKKNFPTIETYSTVAVPFKNYLSYSDFFRYIILIGKYTDSHISMYSTRHNSIASLRQQHGCDDGDDRIAFLAAFPATLLRLLLRTQQ